MKQLFILILSVLIVFTFSACNENANSNSNNIVEIYKTKATEYIENGDTESAITVLEEGVSATNDESLKKMLEELKMKTDTTSNNSSFSSESVNSQNTNLVSNEIVDSFIGKWDDQNRCFMTINHINGNKFDITIDMSSSAYESSSWSLTGTYDFKKKAILYEGKEIDTIYDIENENSKPKEIVKNSTGYIYIEDKTGNLFWQEYSSYINEPTILTKSTEFSLNKTTKGEYDDIIGSYVDAYGSGEYQIHIEYKDNTKSEALIKINFPNNRYYEVPIINRNDFNITGNLMSGGSEPICAADLTITNSGWIEAGIYFSKTDEYETIVFMPVK